MQSRMRAKTTPTGYIALVSGTQHLLELPVVRFDDDGYAMVSDFDTGRLVRVGDFPGFQRVIPMWQTGGAK